MGILKELGRKKKEKVLIGFAAETEDLVKNAKEKLKAKNLDMIVANDITKEGAGFEIETNIATLITTDSTEELHKMTKLELGQIICDRVKSLLSNVR